MTCPKCGFPNAPGSQFCGRCGHTISQSQQGMPTRHITSRPPAFIGNPRPQSPVTPTIQRDVVGTVMQVMVVIIRFMVEITMFSVRVTLQIVEAIMRAIF